jgi:hypothetical protein
MTVQGHVGNKQSWSMLALALRQNFKLAISYPHDLLCTCRTQGAGLLMAELYIAQSLQVNSLPYEDDANGTH